MNKNLSKREKRKIDNDSSDESSDDDLFTVHKSKRNISKKTRNESSLSVLTTKFLDLLNKSKDGTIDLNDAVDMLGVQKRRIYDITNVLEGIGYIKKFTKNKIQMIDQMNEHGLDEQLDELIREMKKLEDQEKECDANTALLEQELETIMNDPEQMKFAYITEMDIQSLMNNNKIKTPYVLVEASENTKIDYFMPPNKELNDLDSATENCENRINQSECSDENQYQILIESQNVLNLYFAMDHK